MPGSQVGGLTHLTLVAATCACFVLTGCSETPAESGDPVQESAAVGAYDREKHLAEAAAAYGIVDPPHVDPIREITPAESADVINSCLEDRGWVQEARGGFSVPEEQIEALDLDSYICEASYPLKVELTTPLTDQQWGLVYDHRVEVFLPCARNVGFDVAEPPTKETFVASPEGWDPVADLEGQLVDAVLAGRYASFEDFYQRCPPAPAENDLRPQP